MNNCVLLGSQVRDGKLLLTQLTMAKNYIVIADDDEYCRIQVESIEKNEEYCYVENKWRGGVYFSRATEWGYISPIFSEERYHLDYPSSGQCSSTSKNVFKGILEYK